MRCGVSEEACPRISVKQEKADLREHRPEWRSVSGWPGAERRKHDAVDGKNEIPRFWLFDKATHMTDLFDRWVVMVLLFLRYRNFLNFMNKFVDNIVT